MLPAPARAALMRWLLPRLIPLALSAATALVAIPAQAGPYSLCASLLNSSAVFPKDPIRTLASGCAGIDTNDPNAVTIDLTSSHFGSFVGTASASSDAFDTVRLFVSVALTDYRAGSYIEEVPGGGIPFAGSAFATYRDLVTVSGPDQSARLEATFGVSGLLEWNGVAAQLCYSFAFGGPTQGGPCLVEPVLPPQITAISQPFPVNSTQEMNFSFDAVVFVSDKNFPDLYTVSAIADLAHTITLKELLILGTNNQPIQGITVSSELGFDYPVSPLNLASPVPEPSAAALLAAGVLLFAAIRRRRRA